MTFIGITPRSTDRGAKPLGFFKDEKKSKDLPNQETPFVGGPRSCIKPWNTCFRGKNQARQQMEVWGVGAVLFLGSWVVY